ncbi:ABC transporter substrate-binding protein [Sphaerisporangium album]|uniref:ABC transporter substrate-binding protein n=1 Tax=Sphaerisporangium album TaxID=509200 RepID=A0A367FMN9_9ACTN|nr:substrate-binding domain-containing protein [Sphaerisporangium album]RCG31663.1 ABC transporter substrate-binding protein [Sphaerisporangium album]
MNKQRMIALTSTALVLGLTACSPANSTDSPASTGESTGRTYTYTSDQDGVQSIEGVELASSLGEFTPAKKHRVAVILKALTNQYWQGIEKGAKAAAAKYGVEVTIQAASSEKAQAEQLTIAQTLIGQKFDAYVVAPESTSNLSPALNQMRQQGAPIVNVDDARVPATVYVGPDHELDGSQAADELAKLSPGGGEVAQIEGQSGSSAAILRIKGFKEGVAKHPNLKLVASVPGNWDANVSYSAAQQVIQQNPNLKGIYANNDTMAIGVAKAVKESGKNIAVIGTDGVPEAVSAVRGGSMAATVSPLPYYEGYWAVESAVGLLEGKQIAPWVVAPAQTITKDNVGQFYDESGQVITTLYK